MLTFHQRREEGYVCSLPPAGRQVQSNLFQLLRSDRPPFFDFALQTTSDLKLKSCLTHHLHRHFCSFWSRFLNHKSNGRGVRRNVPPQNSSQQRRVQTLRRRQSSLHFAHRHFVLRCRTQQRQASGTEQNTSVGDVRPVMTISLLSLFRGLILQTHSISDSRPLQHLPLAMPLRITLLWSPPNRLLVSWSTCEFCEWCEGE